MNDLILTKRTNRPDPYFIDEYINTGGYNSLKKALLTDKEKMIAEIKASGLSGRGGANFPTGKKIESVFEQDGEKYLVCNADEGEPGNFKDRFLIEHDPHLLIEGMIILAYLIDCKKAYIYIREEYDKAEKILITALKEAREHNLLGDNINHTNFCFDIKIFSGAGSYLCGEEYALIASIEGSKGKTREKPPFPTTSGLFGKPTLLLNVETISNISFIIEEGADKYSAIGTPSSKGTRLISLSGNVKNKGVFEVPLGTSLRTIIEDLGQTKDNIKIIQLGGPSGPIIPYNMIDIKLDYEELKKEDLALGSGAIIVINNDYDLFEILKNNIRFFKYESCGKCTPCREGLTEVANILDRFINKSATKSDLENLELLVNVIKDTSYCGLGVYSVTSIITSLKYFHEEFVSRVID